MPTRLHPFERELLETVRRRRLFARGARVLSALSGGPDSTALLAALVRLRELGELGDVQACHVDHQLRPGSAVDADFCAGVCRALGVALHRRTVTVAPGQNLQAAARTARYRALRRAAEACGAERVATGHTRSDQAETVLHRLLRGSGARGLAGIPARRGSLVRPLIDLSRAAVIAYLRYRGLTWREDPSNASPRFLRNRIRGELLPVLEVLAPGIERRLATTADLLREDDRVLERAAAAATARPVAVARELLALPLAVRRRVVRRLWRAATGSRRNLGAGHVEAVLRLIRRGTNGSVALPGGLEARMSYGTLEITAPPPPPPPLEPVLIDRAGPYHLPGRGTVEIGWASPRAPPWPLELRTRRPGDRFHPAGRRGGKKLKAWLIDQKVPRSRRDYLVVLVDREGRVLSLPELGAKASGTKGLEVTMRPERGRPS